MRALVLVALVGCTDAASSDPALDQLLAIPEGQYRPGPFPDEDGGPASIQVSTRIAAVVIGQLDGEGRGVFEPSARAAVVGIDGYDGTWIVPAGVPEIDTPGQPVARYLFGVREGLPPGPFTLRMAAADEDGRFGSSGTTTIVAAAAEPPTGELVIGLAWTGPADLDLHVIDALGGEAWSDKPNTMIPPPPGTPIDPGSTEHLKHGQLDHDGNRGCVQHANPAEHVIWQMPPPPGEYTVRVDTRSMCGAPIAQWYVAVYRSGELIASARGTSTPEDVLLGIDTLGLGRAGAGVTALRFSL